MDASVALDAVFRDQWGGVLATLVGILGDIELAEDAAAEAFAIAAERWPRDGEPASPTGWLITTARNRAIDQLRRQQVLAARDMTRGRNPPDEVIPDELLAVALRSPSTFGASLLRILDVAPWIRHSHLRVAHQLRQQALIEKSGCYRPACV
jgi:predicted RNA polymerase sigma factor